MNSIYLKLHQDKIIVLRVYFKKVNHMEILRIEDPVS